MRAIKVNNGYGLDQIEITDYPVPEVGADEVLVKVNAISLNQLDIMVAEGIFGTPLPHILGSDASGVVVQVGHSVKHFAVGDRICTHFIQDWQDGDLKAEYLKSRLGTDVNGVFSEYICLSERALVKIPDHMSFTEASTLPIAALVAWEAVVNTVGIKPGQSLLVQGTGGASVFALQIAKMIGAKVIITSGSDEKLEVARKLGADITVNYRRYPEWQHRILELTDGEGADVAVEMSWAELNKTAEVVKLNGKIAVVGLLGGQFAELSAFPVLQKSLTIHGVQVGSRTSFEDMIRAFGVNAIRPYIDRVFPVEDIAEAMKYFRNGKHIGKVVLTF
ncbi:MULTISPECIES: zinc-dependent alcohol dehydrogenase family protein [Chryseobacterium]|uniref:NADPH:quinone reductase-like Zn-dependent oxidoreductase n=1 Tax=Chryseobacterium camelliae TaxID=1265445 RepID=A0ABU0TI92_9FLAO|nr:MULTISPECIES: NAD(P)-dependent alcohol dehydrogenase [Chryseobacterium]MDT3409372.1 NADPH:quinone reductase-like Zn-dependent oxidoreductase [Pseudacidovorax intermedius]MDQ1096763.1 NADPH:quinone reductase-like Zn-dependent oxidoreductase [Chryseobacterium camelliae]MDQ1100706.1 NADPH:quinone reductase-like Zn-dependent oxidoreductase [Chryseobacterium sp. SORGH_AS_1048]MDR6088045.1 NADPH:quinone reductase-like Zn-dependent oxidoreductase [Chryseobacterium sp. SORGH_AS_0909]MDR6132419.1 NA